MQTNIDPRFQNVPEAMEADSILRSCVHCGFCTATCPTYQELSDERDGPRGRIYLIKQFLEGGEVTENTRLHLDRCLTCRSCETTCPSGVKYGRLLDIGRGLMEEQMPRPLYQRILRWGLRQVLPFSARFSALLSLGRVLRPLLPKDLQQQIPEKTGSSPWPKGSHPRVMLALAGCVQSVSSPNTNAAAARVLDKLGITLVEIPEAGCCGAVSYHLGAHHDGLDFMRKNIDAWWPAVEQGAESIVVTASGCGVMVKEYGYLLRNDPVYADKAKKISELAADLAAVLSNEDLFKLTIKEVPGKVAVHCPCTQQHGLQQGGVVEQLLSNLGIDLARTSDQHLCCGSAGTYSVLQPELSQKLRDKKLKVLTQGNPDQIVTANIGCQLHLGSQSELPVNHWIELLDKYSS